jgi:hypothetical protein
MPISKTLAEPLKTISELDFHPAQREGQLELELA